jgi:hypothetical protein
MNEQHSAGTSKERAEFEKWLQDVHGLSDTWDDKRNCYTRFPAHLAFCAWQAGAAPETRAVQEPAGVAVAPDLYRAASHLLSHWDAHRKCFELCGTAVSELQEALAASAAPGHPEPPAPKAAATHNHTWQTVMMSAEEYERCMYCGEFRKPTSQNGNPQA